MGGRLSVVRVLGVLEPGGAQLSALWLSAALRRCGVATTLLAGDATPAGMALAVRFGFPVEAFRMSELPGPRSLQWTPEPAFADWLGPRLAPADVVHAHMVGAWWAAARAVPPGVPLVASEHNQMTWPDHDYTAEARAAARRVDLLFTHGPAVTAWAAGLGLGGRLREGRSSVEGLSARPFAGLAWPRITFTGRFRDDNPLFCSLELADGNVTVYDLERLRKVPQRIVLSSCESGLSAVHAGDELMGFTAALFALGTCTIIAAVVPVPDEATKGLMLALDEELTNGTQPAQALVNARRDKAKMSVAAAAFVCFGAG